MWSVEVGIQRRTEGHRNLVDDFDLPAAATVDAVVVEAAAGDDELTSSAIEFDHFRPRLLMRFPVF